MQDSLRWGTFMILSPKKAQAQSNLPDVPGFGD